MELIFCSFVILHSDVSWPEIPKNTSLFFNGSFFTARDGTFRRLFSEGRGGFFRDKILYFCGPTPTPTGKIIGSCGPTTSTRMEPFFSQLVAHGVKAFVGKGPLSPSAQNICDAHGVFYFSAVGGVGALLAECVREKTTEMYPELGAEAVFRLRVHHFPVLFPGNIF